MIKQQKNQYCWLIYYLKVSKLSDKTAIHNQYGFTLLELLIVVIILGILAAMFVPGLLAQIGKARETEAKNAIATVLRAEQAYHFEKGEFVDSGSMTINQVFQRLGVSITSNYYSFSSYKNGSGSLFVISANYKGAWDDPSGGVNNGIRRYKGGIAFDQGNYYTGICQANKIGLDYFEPSFNTGPQKLYCDGDATKIQ